MIVYFDTSALVPLLVAEPTSAVCERLWLDADGLVTSRLTYVEAAAAMARAERLKRLTGRSHARAIRQLDELWDYLNVVEVDSYLVRLAARLARTHGLRGYDAVHCAAVERLVAPELVAATGDKELLAAWEDLGVVTVDINGG